MNTHDKTIDNDGFLNWTGHPLVDVGIATLCAMSKKNDPKSLTLEDLDQAADQMAEYYFSGLMTSYLTCVFMNSAYVQPNMSEEKRKEYEDKILRAHRFPSMANDGTRCPFSSREASASIHRGQLPLLTGEDVLNFYPAGRGALPIAGAYLVALQALPLGGRRTEGKLLIAHGDDPAITLAFAQKYLADNQRILNLAKNGKLPQINGPSLELEREQAAWDSKKKLPKYSDAKAPSTLIANDLMEIYRTKMGMEFRARRDISVTAYWLSNSGQGPSLEIFHIPAQVTRFLRMVDAAPYGPQWRNLVAKAWRPPNTQKAEFTESGEEKKKRRKKKTDTLQVPGGPGRSRNDLLSDLFAIYENGFMDLRTSKIFLRRHLLGDASYRNQRIRNNTGREDVTKLRDPGMTDWPLTELFLKEVIGVDERRVEAIKRFADGLALHISQTNDKSLFRSLIYCQRPWEVRNALTKAQRNQAKDHGQLLFGLEEYLEVFEADDAIGRSDWSLSRDLISIRLVEQLHGKDFFKKEENLELLAEPEIQPAEMTT